METNYRYSVELLDYCLARDVPLIYASSAAVYGASTVFKESDRAAERPLNVYGYSKLLFDSYVRRRRVGTRRGARRRAPSSACATSTCTGPAKAHKGAMASVAFHLHGKSRPTGEARLFEGSGGYAAGEQRRDFVYVDDVVERQPLVLRAAAGFRHLQRRHRARARPSTRSHDAIIAWHGKGAIRYIPFPAELKSRYQSFTEADISALRAAGYTQPFRDVRAGIKDLPRRASAAPLVTVAPTRCSSSARRGWATWSWRRRSTGCLRQAEPAPPRSMCVAPAVVAAGARAHARSGARHRARRRPRRARARSPRARSARRLRARALCARDRAAALSESRARPLVREDSAAHRVSRRVALWIAERRAPARCAARPDRQAVRGARRGRAASAAVELPRRSAAALAHRRRATSSGCGACMILLPTRAARRADAGRGIRPREALAGRAATARSPPRSRRAARTSSCSAPRRSARSATRSRRAPRARACATCAARTTLADVVDLSRRRDVAVSNDSGLAASSRPRAGHARRRDLRLVVAGSSRRRSRPRTTVVSYRDRVQPVLRARVSARSICAACATSRAPTVLPAVDTRLAKPRPALRGEAWMHRPEKLLTAGPHTACSTARISPSPPPQLVRRRSIGSGPAPSRSRPRAAAPFSS